MERDIASIRGWCDTLGIPHAAAAAAYREAAARRLLAGRHIRGMLAAATYVGARRTAAPVTLLQVSDVTGERQKSIRRMALLIDPHMPPQDVWVYIRGIVQRLNLPSDLNISLNDIRVDIGAPLRAGIAVYVASHNIDMLYSIEEVAVAAGLNPKTMRYYVKNDGTVKPKAVAS